MAGSAPSRSTRKGAAPTVNEKPGFSGAQLPGATQKRSRSNGMKGCRVYPDSKGLG